MASDNNFPGNGVTKPMQSTAYIFERRSANPIYTKSTLLNVLDTLFLLNLFLLTNASSAAYNLWSPYCQWIAAITSVSFSVGLFFIIIILHLRWKFNLRKLKTCFGQDVHHSSVTEDSTTMERSKSLSDYATEEHPGSPPSQVYDTRRGKHQFELIFDKSPLHTPHTGVLSPLTPVLREREPLLFDPNT